MEFKDLPKEVYDKVYSQYHTDAARVRGNVLNAACALEMSIDLYITDHFTNDVDKSEELMNLIIAPRMSFENKVQAFFVLLERHNPTILTENPTIKNDIIKQIIEERNVLAHYPLDSTDWGLKRYYDTGDLTFFKFKNVRESNGEGKPKETKLTNTVIYNMTKAGDLLKLIDKYHEIIAASINGYRGDNAPPPTL